MELVTRLARSATAIAGPLLFVEGVRTARLGEMVSIRIGNGFLAPTARAVVCWTQPGAGGVERAIGLRMIVEGRSARVWRGLVAEVARSGARTA